MKIQFSILVILLGFMMSFSYAEDKNDPPKKPTTERVSQVLMKRETNRHRAPSNVSITFFFTEGTVTFEESPYYATLDVTVLDEASGDTWNGLITTDSPSISGPFDEGIYTVTCVNEQGQTFVGYFEL